MNKLHIALAAALALGSQFAAAQASVPFEGGQSANAFALGQPLVSATSPRASAAVALDSRSGQQSEVEQASNRHFTPSRTRDEVRAEAASVGRELGAQAATSFE